MGNGDVKKNGKVYNTYVPRYILRFCATDFTEKMFNSNVDKYEEMKNAQFKKYVFKCKTFSDVWEGSTRISYDCIGVEVVNPQQESEKLLEKNNIFTKFKK
eukprot:530567_1